MKLILLSIFFSIVPQLREDLHTNNRNNPNQKDMKIQVEIWTDVMCPFCYIGKRKFEIALQQANLDQGVEIRWRSFQLNPSLKNESGLNAYEYLARAKGWTLEHSREMHHQVSDMARQVGLEYNFDKAVVANSFDAHRLLQYARLHGKANPLSEILFNAYFCKGLNTSSTEELLQIGMQAGLEEAGLKNMLSGNACAAEVQDDINLARQLGITGVPFFIFNGKYAVSGAQQPEVFINVLQKCLEEQPATGPENDPKHICTPDKECH
jgi:predicted DsbA family dithiol-disulfide isomerase